MLCKVLPPTAAFWEPKLCNLEPRASNYKVWCGKCLPRPRATFWDPNFAIWSPGPPGMVCGQVAAELCAHNCKCCKPLFLHCAQFGQCGRHGAKFPKIAKFRHRDSNPRVRAEYPNELDYSGRYSPGLWQFAVRMPSRGVFSLPRASDPAGRQGANTL